ncbi:MAG: hypothetical protein PHO83_14430 [Geobacteraceae bacterium]|nr:hypothetical protein [Geobacteraceae bacterium]
MKNYSQFITTLHDDNYPVGHLGYGTHYSVLRTTSWFDSCRLPLKEPQIQDLAIIWDKDRDKRIIDFVEHLYMKNLLAPVLFVGESTGHLSVILSPLFKVKSKEHDYEVFVSSIIELAKNQFEPWTAEVRVFGETLAEFKIIKSSSERVELYLNNIFMLWDLGLKDFRLGLSKPELYSRPEIEII